MRGGEVAICVFLILTVAVVGTIFVEEIARTPAERGSGVIISKHFNPAHVVLVPCGKGLIPRYVPDVWEVTVGFDGESLEVTVDQEFYGMVSPGSQVGFDFSRGRLFGSIQIEVIWLEE